MSTGSDAGVQDSSTELSKIMFKLSCTQGGDGEVFGGMPTSEVVASALPSVMCANVRSRALQLYLTRFRRLAENVGGDASKEKEASLSSSLSSADSLRFMVGGFNHGCRVGCWAHVVI